MEHILLNDDEKRELNKVYNGWPGYTLIAMDGGGRGYFMKSCDDRSVFLLGDMGDPSDPKYLCDGIENIESSVRIIDEKNERNNAVVYQDMVVIVDKCNLSQIRLVQELSGETVLTMKELASRLGQELVIGRGLHPQKIKGIIDRQPIRRLSLRDSV